MYVEADCFVSVGRLGRHGRRQLSVHKTNDVTRAGSSRAGFRRRIASTLSRAKPRSSTILLEVGRRRLVGGQEDMIVNHNDLAGFVRAQPVSVRIRTRQQLRHAPQDVQHGRPEPADVGPVPARREPRPRFRIRTRPASRGRRRSSPRSRCAAPFPGGPGRARR
ncbi:hypothetical protein [Saccharopolyspora hattusasensis]|uniref:hypothetical protein n=1 Tax=Saccharopolyspora hattusasensis TaxID=1128679 RepID=UPI003D96204A